jgi:transcriptional regulator GlxA family with amidase domain
MRQVIVVAVPHFQILDLAGPAQAFYEARRLGADYQIVTCATTQRVRAAQGCELSDLAPLPFLRLGPVSSRPVVVVPGLRIHSLPQVDAALYAWLRDAHVAGAHMLSVCTGAFVLGAAGLLDGRQCTTHWTACGELQRRFPTARVLNGRLFVSDSRITSSAGAAAGIDQALAVIGSHHGPQIAATTARAMVVAQQQQSLHLSYRLHVHPGVHRVQDWLVAHAAERFTLEQLAAVAVMSSRHLTRLFRRETGMSISQYAARLRLELARTLILDARLTIEGVAARCGFTNARRLRRHWQKVFGSSPSKIRAKADDSSLRRSFLPHRKP